MIASIKLKNKKHKMTYQYRINQKEKQKQSEISLKHKYKLDHNIKINCKIMQNNVYVKIPINEMFFIEKCNEKNIEKKN